MKRKKITEHSGGDRKICLIGTYPPRECGIATFTSDLREALVTSVGGINASAIAITNTPEAYDYPTEVAFEIRQNRLADYRLAAEYINFSGADLVCLQHEFGIFGGPEGRYIAELLTNLHKPVVTTLHTAIREPQPGYRESLLRVAAASHHLVVMSNKAVSILKDVYGISEDKVSVIHHGVPDVSFVDPNYYKDKFGVEGRLVLLTFGLLSRNKGIELVLEALPSVVARDSRVVYIVLGATHPEVKRRQGEEYRLWLQRRVRELGLEDHVIFHDRYVALSELIEFIGACDIYVTPYQSKEQMTSGTLAYAVGMGKAVVSTPYFYAEELLSDGRGRLVNFGDTRGLSQAFIEMIENKAMRHKMRKRAYEYGRDMTWPEVGREYSILFERTIAGPESKAIARSGKRAGLAYDLPEVKLDYLVRLTDDTSIMQHATYGVPDRRFGYATDDAARALVVALMHYQQFGDETVLPLVSRYLSFIQHAQTADGRFHNFMGYGREFTDECGSEDTLGRALWGLGVTVACGPTEGVGAMARDMFERAMVDLEMEHPRAMAYAICGLHAFLQRYDGAAQVRRKLVDLADQLASLYDAHSDEGWRWFGDEMTYANAKLPQAMLLAYQATEDERYKKIGLESLEFLLLETFHDPHFDFIGNQGWYRRGGERAIFSQQPIEAGYTAEACATAFEVTGHTRYFSLGNAAVEWLLGRNRLGIRLYDLATGACSDGLEAQGASMNQGAESIVCCLLGLLAACHLVETKADTEREVAPRPATAPSGANVVTAKSGA
jgi:glycosyltransferase involved in cell wall biosynthesis